MAHACLPCEGPVRQAQAPPPRRADEPPRPGGVRVVGRVPSHVLQDPRRRLALPGQWPGRGGGWEVVVVVMWVGGGGGSSCSCDMGRWWW